MLSHLSNSPHPHSITSCTLTQSASSSHYHTITLSHYHAIPCQTDTMLHHPFLTHYHTITLSHYPPSSHYHTTHHHTITLSHYPPSHYHTPTIITLPTITLPTIITLSHYPLSHYPPSSHYPLSHYHTTHHHHTITLPTITLSHYPPSHYHTITPSHHNHTEIIHSSYPLLTAASTQSTCTHSRPYSQDSWWPSCAPQTALQLGPPYQNGNTSRESKGIRGRETGRTCHQLELRNTLD